MAEKDTNGRIYFNPAQHLTQHQNKNFRNQMVDQIIKACSMIKLQVFTLTCFHNFLYFYLKCEIFFFLIENFDKMIKFLIQKS